MIANLLALVLLSWAGLTTIVSAVALLRARRSGAWASTPALRSACPARVCLLRPCTGDDAFVEPALLSTRAVCGPQVRVVFSVASAEDSAWPIVRRCAARLRDQGHDVEARVVCTQGLNQKVGQLAELSSDTPEPVIVCVDADVDLAGVDLATLLTTLLASPDTGAVWLPPAEVLPPQSLGDRISGAVLGASLHAFRLLGELDPGGLVGKVFAVRTEALRQAGGFAALENHLGEDMELARRLHQCGYATRMGSGMAPSLAARRGLRAILARYTRWLLVIRAQRPALLLSYPIVLAAAPVQLVAAAVLWFVVPQAAIAAAALVLCARAAVGVAAASLQGQPRRVTPARWMLADVALLLVFVRALGPARVRWHSRTLQLGRRGRLCAAR